MHCFSSNQKFVCHQLKKQNYNPRGWQGRSRPIRCVRPPIPPLATGSHLGQVQVVKPGKAAGGWCTRRMQTANAPQRPAEDSTILNNGGGQLLTA